MMRLQSQSLGYRNVVLHTSEHPIKLNAKTFKNRKKGSDEL